ncbi:MAG: mycothione reductase [Acidimicrobiales bacterium]|nr:MAG: mycothione reductase [Acidimicrobiales bacterium]
MTQHFDVLIIGTGSGNSILTPDFDDKQVAIVERGVFGGTCLNRGCIPSKMFVYAAEVAELAETVGPRLGVNTSFSGADWPAIRDRVFDRIDPIASGGEHYRDIEQDHVTVFKGNARFTGHKVVAVELNDGGTVDVTADEVVLAAGARVSIPEVVSASGVTFHTSDSIMRIDELPRHLIVLGGGYIGAELGNVFGMLGSDVSIVVRSDRMLRQEDPDISSRFTDAYASKFNVYTNAPVLEISGGDGEVEVTITQNGEPVTISGDMLLVATGRTPNGTELNVEATGVGLDEYGYVVTDEFLQTGVDGVWALGDITNPAQLKHTANAEARVVAHNIVNPDELRPIDRRLTPHAIFGHPQVAGAGLTEPEAIAAGYTISTVVQPYGAAAYGWAMEDTESVCKLIADADTRLLLGAHIIGPQASTLIQQLIQGMTFGQTVDEMASAQLYIHPALSEVVEQALLEL